MGTSPNGAYTAKLTDGPLEGRTITTDFLDSGEPQPRLEISAVGGEKRYVYSRSGGVEFASDSGDSDRPSAVDYRYIEAVFN
ncbi:hypothetical protein HII28_13960 [Planctomonas sp. JC2975]|uniref:hypothetical protein n=1 Tax=Planctomonas sp. JC2975 TaxID=2729626 RepID=UPI001472BB7F|nr:hypothetical protein [Planctomonas sp. JC2975]NNC12976.1 hypothetical protein [Planctomonas sp. JC2975]